MNQRYSNRAAAGRELASHLQQYRGRSNVIILGLPRGGVPVAFEVAQSLDVPLDVLIVRKLGAPGQPEFALGAIASGGITVINPEAPPGLLDTPQFARERLAEFQELERREQLYRGKHAAPAIQGNTVILIDDGAATGASMLAAVRAAQQLGAQRIVVALPVASSTACDALRSEADEVLCVNESAAFLAVGDWYRDFAQTSDREVAELLARAQ